MSKASEKAYQILRKRILNGALTPGERIKEEQLAEICGVSRTPVRTAIQRLEHEMLVVRASGRRSYITKWSSEDIAEVYTLRVLLESHAAERAATLISDATIHALKRSIEAIDKALAKRANARTFLDHNLEFHGLIMAASQSRRIYPILARLVPQPVVDRTALRYELSDMRQSISDHRDIVRALEAHDPALAKALMSSHIRRGYQTYIRLDEDGQKTK